MSNQKKKEMKKKTAVETKNVWVFENLLSYTLRQKNYFYLSIKNLTFFFFV